MRCTQVVTRASPRNPPSRVATLTRISCVASSASCGCQSIRRASRRTSSATRRSSSSSASRSPPTAAATRRCGTSTAGHAVSRWAFSTVQLARQFGDLRVEDLVGQPGRLVHGEGVQRSGAVRHNAGVRRRLDARRRQRDEIDHAGGCVRVDAQRHPVAACQRHYPAIVPSRSIALAKPIAQTGSRSASAT